MVCSVHEISRRSGQDLGRPAQVWGPAAQNEVLSPEQLCAIVEGRWVMTCFSAPSPDCCGRGFYAAGDHPAARWLVVTVHRLHVFFHRLHEVRIWWRSAGYGHGLGLRSSQQIRESPGMIIMGMCEQDEFDQICIAPSISTQ
jgi:hypothetical protein